MRQLLSVLMLMTRSTLHKILLILAAMAAVQSSLFFFVLHNAMERYTETSLISTRLDFLFSESRLILFFGLAFLLTTAVLVLIPCDLKGRQSYTWKRLSVPERGIFFRRAFYNSCCYFLLWGIQLILVLGLSAVYLKVQIPDAVDTQTVMLAFYRNEFLHSLLPLADVQNLIRNFILCVGLGFAAAVFPLRLRKRKPGLEILCLVPLSLIFFRSEMGDMGSSMVLGMMSLLVILLSVRFIYRKEDTDEA